MHWSEQSTIERVSSEFPKQLVASDVAQNVLRTIWICNVEINKQIVYNSISDLTFYTCMTDNEFLIGMLKFYMHGCTLVLTMQASSVWIKIAVIKTFKIFMCILLPKAFPHLHSNAHPETASVHQMPKWGVVWSECIFVLYL